MRRLPDEADPVALDADGAKHRAQRQIHGLEHRALLDMQLQIGGGALESPRRRADAVQVHTVVADRVLQTNALTVGQVAHGLWVHRSGGRARAKQAAAKARALFIGPVHQAKGDGRDALGGDPAQDLEPGHDAQAAVEPAAVRHGVQVTADQQLTIRPAAQCHPEIGGLVQLTLHGQAGELAAKPRPRRRPRGGEGDALRSAGVARQPAQLLQIGDHDARIKGPHMRKEDDGPVGARLPYSSTASSTRCSSGERVQPSISTSMCAASSSFR